MPPIDPMHYQPQGDEPGLMSQSDRAAACTRHYQRLEADGKGRVITLDDGRAWFVPADAEGIGNDIALAIHRLHMDDLRVVLGAAFANLAGALTPTAQVTQARKGRRA